MLVHNLIVITSNRVTPRADQQIDSLLKIAQRFHKRLILVLGPDGDELLRLTSNQLDAYEIVFDPNFEPDLANGLFSGVKAGLQACEGLSFAALVIELGTLPMPSTQWAALERELFHHQGNEHVLHPVTHDNDAPLSPFVITAKGAIHLLNLPADLIWTPQQVISAPLRIAAFSEDPSAGAHGQA